MFIAGLSAGSFVNALVWRLHEHKDWLNGRSECVKCHHKLAAIDLVPVISWIILRGRCRYCHQKISIQYPIVELATLSLYLISYELWPRQLSGAEIAVFVLWLGILTGLIALAVYDLRWMLLPSKLIYVLLTASIIMTCISVIAYNHTLSALVNYLVAVLIGGGLFYAIFTISKGKWIGGGDVRLGFLLGLLAATPGRSFLMIFLASLLGLIVSLPFLTRHKLNRSSIIPFGPFLIAALIVVQFAGQDIIQLYTRFFING